MVEPAAEREWLRYLAGLPIAVLFASAGYGHFASYKKFAGIMRGMPLSSLHPAAVYISGALELWLGVAMMIAPSGLVCRRLFWLVVCMSPANINMYINDVPFGRAKLSYGFGGTHMMRAFLQIVLLGYLYMLGRWWSRRALWSV